MDEARAVPAQLEVEVAAVFVLSPKNVVGSTSPRT